MKEVFHSGAFASFKLKKVVRFKQEEDRLLKNAKLHHRTGSNGDVKQDNSPPPYGYKPKVVQGVKPSIVLVEGIKCRSQLKCNARPGLGEMRAQGALLLWGERKRRKYNRFFTRGYF